MIYLGFFAAMLTTVSFIPQTYKIWKSNDTTSISLSMFILFNIGVFSWLAYGFLKNDPAIIFANLFTMVMSLFILYKKIANNILKK